MEEDDVKNCKVSLKWITPDAEKTIIEIAKVSSADPDAINTKLLKYLIDHFHWSPFEMAYMCLEIECSRAISRQILRHRSFTFQEFSQRYQTVAILDEPIMVDARSQDTKNRQNSIDNMSDEIKNEWRDRQFQLCQSSRETYDWALSKGIAKEVARSVLAEGNTPTRLFMCGNIRSWITYCNLRCGNGTQKEHVDVSNLCKEIFRRELPYIAECLGY